MTHNEYPLNCFVNGSVFKCRFNLSLSSRGWQDQWTEISAHNETPMTNWQGTSSKHNISVQSESIIWKIKRNHAKSRLHNFRTIFSGICQGHEISRVISRYKGNGQETVMWCNWTERAAISQQSGAYFQFPGLVWHPLPRWPIGWLFTLCLCPLASCRQHKLMILRCTHSLFPQTPSVI